MEVRDLSVNSEEKVKIMAVNLESLRKHLSNPKIKVNKVFETPNNGDYYPPGWKHNGLSFEQTIKESEQRIETSRIQIENGELFFVRNMADYYWKLKTLEQFTEEEKSRKYHHPDSYANSPENS